jgi:hypothetical protein
VSYLDDIGVSPTSPTLAGLDDARHVIADLSMDEYALARVLASEYAGGTPTELCCIGDAECNEAKARGRTLADHITAGTGAWGSQGSAGAGDRKRPMSSARAPGPRHVRAAVALTRGPWNLLPSALAPARGIAQGARRYFDPRSQISSADSSHCHPLIVLERWTYDLPWAGTCVLGTTRGRDQQEWVGPIKGVDAYQLMLFRPATPMQDALYAAARRVIETQGADQSGPTGPIPLPVAEFLLVIALAAAAGWLASHGVGGLV